MYILIYDSENTLSREGGLPKDTEGHTLSAWVEMPHEVKNNKNGLEGKCESQFLKTPGSHGRSFSQTSERGSRREAMTPRSWLRSSYRVFTSLSVWDNSTCETLLKTNSIQLTQ